ncbi:MAG: hypothetical protein D6689_01405 [Deltaproteobacteria bacterium]|nr:MAG: hypothetical protein D6689_01405 [Deltaproteobacteria bacterium]
MVIVRRALVACCAAALAACSARPKTAGSGDSAGRLTVFVTTEVKGQTEPCGCTSDPMGDLARTAALIAGARRAGPVVVVDGGSLLYGEARVRPDRAVQAERKADLVAEVYRDRLGAAAIGLGPFDLASGPDGVRLPRQAANARGVRTEPPKVIDAGGVRVGVFGVVDPARVAKAGVDASDPVAAARDAVRSLAADGAQVIVALLHMSRADARSLAAAVPGIHLAVVGADAPEPDRVSPAPERAGDAWLVQPANRGQVVSRIDLTWRGPGPLADAIGPARARAELAELDRRIAVVEADVAKFAADPAADPTFVAAQRADLAELRARRAALAAEPLRVPAEGSYFVLEQIPIRKALACDADVVAKKRAYDLAVGRDNLARAPAEPPPVPPGQAGYAGIGECAFCHADAVAFWRGTVHARAWETLEQLGKQYDLECVYCHVTGFDRPGGATLKTLANPPEGESLRDVQCEVCHGPASLHVDADGKERPRSLVRAPPVDTCVTCHNELHSDTFDYEAYLRDVTGPGHGEAFRARLGDGPTGRQLRRAALEAAGAAIGEGCDK